MQKQLLENHAISHKEHAVTNGLLREIDTWRRQVSGFSPTESVEQRATRAEIASRSITHLLQLVEEGRQTSLQEGQIGETRNEPLKARHVTIEVGALDRLKDATIAAQKLLNEFLVLQQTDPRAARSKDLLVETLEEQIPALIKAYQKISDEEESREAEALVEDFRASDNHLIVVAIAAMIATLIISWMLAKVLTRPLKDLASVAHAISQGNQQHRVPASHVMEFDAVGDALNHMLDDLQRTTISRDDLERTVQERIHELDSFFRLSVDMLCIADYEGKFLRVNAAFEKVSGFPMEEFADRPFLDFVIEEDREKTIQETARLVDGHLTLDFENRYLCQDGATRTLSWKCVPVPELRQIYAAARDVTELRATEEALRQSEENLAVTLHSIGDGVLTTDAAGGIVRMNPVAEKLTGWSIQDALARPVEEVFRRIDGSTREQVIAPITTALSTGQTVELSSQALLIAKDGTERFVSDSASPIRDRSGKIIGAVQIFRDITKERREAEASEQRNARVLQFQQTLLQLRDFDTSDLPTFYRMATVECARAMETERASIWLFDEEHRMLVCQSLYSRQEEQHSEGQCLESGNFPAYFDAISQFEPLVAHDARTHAATSGFLDCYLLPADITSMLDVPIRAGDEFTGVLCFEHTSTPRVWTPEEVKFAGSAANTLLLAIERQEKAATVEKLRASEEYNRSIINNTEDCMKVLTLDGHISYMGEPGQRLLEVKSFDDVRDRSWLTFWTGSDREAAERALERARSGEVGRFQGLCPTFTGKPRWWDSIVSPILDAHGTPSRLLAVSRDITHQRTNEDHIRKLNATLEERIAERTAELAEKEERFRLAIEQIQDYAIIMLSSDGTVMSWNAGAERTYGYTASEVMGQYVSCFYTEEDRNTEVPMELLRLARKNGYVLREGWRRRRDGSSFWGEVVLNAVTDDLGQVVGFAKVTHDLTQRRQSDLALRQSEEQFRSAMENSAIGMALVGLDGRWLKVNPALSLILGYTEDEFLIMDFQTITYPEDLQPDLDFIDRLLKGEIQKLKMEKRYFHKDGHLIWALLNVTLTRDTSGEPRYFISQILDITERKRADEAMKQALEHEKELVREAQAGERAKSEFLAVMSHEVRSPMNGILGFAEMLAQNTELPEDSRDQAQTIVDSGASLLRILDDILDFSRLEAGRLRIENDQFSPRKIVDEIGVLLTPSAHSKGLAFIFDLVEPLPTTCQGDAARVRQILLNLCGNAIKFTEHGAVTIGLKKNPIGPLEGQPSLEFSVRDTGLGVSEDRIAQIFEPFEQADSSTSRRFGGTGLGLTISRRLAELMGGTLTAQSQLGIGSEFYFRLPLKSVGTGKVSTLSERSSIPIDSSFALARPLRILVAEDDRVNLKLILTMIRKFGYQPLAAQDGETAVEAFRREQIDCILMDLQMPGMDGIEATLQVREFEKISTREQPVYITALTANTVPEDQRRCFEAGMNDYLNKPIRHEQLAALLTRAYEHKAENQIS